MISIELLQKVLVKLKEMSTEEILQRLDKTSLSKEQIDSYAFLEKAILEEKME